MIYHPVSLLGGLKIGDTMELEQRFSTFYIFVFGLTISFIPLFGGMIK